MHRIKAGYVENPGPRYFVDNVTAVRGTIFQPDVYAMAELLCELTGATWLEDLGCGWGEKLALVHEQHPDWQFTGVDFGKNLEHCRTTYPWGDWIELNLESEMNLGCDGVIICSDVIEHLADPTELLRAFSLSAARAIVISTPERDVQHGPDHAGPSPNECHVREWNGPELRALLEDHGLTVRWFGLTRSSDAGEEMGTQVVVVTP